MGEAVVSLKRLEVEYLRKISQVELDLDKGVNWFIGGNGAGKTTILEAVFLLSRGRSFRGRRHGTLWQTGREGFRICSSLGVGGHWREVAVRRTSDGVTWLENGVERAGIRDLTVRPQVRLIGENCQRLLEGEPELRRLFLDWNLFHVEPDFAAELTRMRRVTAQRNAWLRSGARGRPVWDAPYVDLAARITAYRAHYIADLNRILQRAVDQISAASAFSLVLSRGWPADRDLDDMLVASLASDVKRGFTYYGPSRADFRLQNPSGRSHLGSRGENKLAVVVLQLAAQRIWQDAGLSCIWLVDDLAAELDQGLCQTILGNLSTGPNQMLATSLSPPADGRAFFYLEQGHLLSST